MKFTELSLAGAFRIDLEPRRDDRGFFARLFCQDEFRRHGLKDVWTQCNVSHNNLTGTLRGMHFQRPPKADAKLVKCMAGSVYDVLVDLRSGSPTYGEWASVELTSEGGEMVYIPQGFAHGFQTLSPHTELLYFHTENYSPEHEGGLCHDDRDVDIAWPIKIGNLSDRDRALPPLSKLEPIS